MSERRFKYIPPLDVNCLYQMTTKWYMYHCCIQTELNVCFISQDISNSSFNFFVLACSLPFSFFSFLPKLNIHTLLYTHSTTILPWWWLCGYKCCAALTLACECVIKSVRAKRRARNVQKLIWKRQKLKIFFPPHLHLDVFG